MLSSVLGMAWLTGGQPPRRSARAPGAAWWCYKGRGDAVVYRRGARGARPPHGRRGASARAARRALPCMTGPGPGARGRLGAARGGRGFVGKVQKGRERYSQSGEHTSSSSRKQAGSAACAGGLWPESTTRGLEKDAGRAWEAPRGQKARGARAERRARRAAAIQRRASGARIRGALPPAERARPPRRLARRGRPC